MNPTSTAADPPPPPPPPLAPHCSLPSLPPAAATEGTAARAATAAFGTGVGTGSSYRDCDYMLQEYQGRILAATRGEKKEKEATE